MTLLRIPGALQSKQAEGEHVRPNKYSLSAVQAAVPHPRCKPKDSHSGMRAALHLLLDAKLHGDEIKYCTW